MNWKVVVLPEFYSDLEEAGDWYEHKLEGLGARFAGRFWMSGRIWQSILCSILKNYLDEISVGDTRTNFPIKSSTLWRGKQNLSWS